MNPPKTPFENIPEKFRHPLKPPKRKTPEPTKREEFALEEHHGVVVPKKYHHNPPRNRY
jgi:hypothetical protein